LAEDTVVSIIKCVAHGTNTNEETETEIQLQCHKIAINIVHKYPLLLLSHLHHFDLMTVFIKLLPNTGIDIDKKANSEMVASALELIRTIEGVLYEYKFLGKSESFSVISTLVSRGFGGLDYQKLYQNLALCLQDEDLGETTLKILTDLWKLWDTKLHNNKAHKPIAEQIMNGLDFLISHFPVRSKKPSAFVDQCLAFIRLVEVGMQKMEKQKKELELKPHHAFTTFVNTSIKKGPLASRYGQLCK